MTNDNDWNQHSMLVLKQLEVLTEGIKTLNDSLNEVKNEITAIKAKEDKVLELLEWKEKIVEVASPSQLKELKNNVSVLQTNINEREIQIETLGKWKTRVDEVASPTHLQKMKDEIEELKTAKIKAYTVFAVVQVIMGLVLFAKEFV